MDSKQIARELLEAKKRTTQALCLTIVQQYLGQFRSDLKEGRVCAKYHHGDRRVCLWWNFEDYERIHSEDNWKFAGHAVLAALETETDLVVSEGAGRIEFNEKRA